MDSVYCNTPFCDLKITQSNGSVCEIEFVQQLGSPQVTAHPVLKQVLLQLKYYIASADYMFDLPLELKGTSFQRSVWEVLQSIPVGQVRTYGDIAAELGSSPRAVGNACRSNPIPLIVPCHRVVSARGLGGFAGQTEGQKISIKQQLLAHEGLKFKH